MYWKKLILPAVILFSACSAIRNSGSSDISIQGNFVDLNKTIAMNISGSDYNILRALVTVSTEADKSEFLLNLRYKSPDNYLASLKSKTGIEAARIFITSDTILINDKLNKRLYFGSSSYLFEKYGINVRALQLLFGDFLTAGNTKQDTLRCFNGVALVSEVLNGRRIDYRINCSTGKVADTYLSSESTNELLHLGFGNIKTIGNSRFPGEIAISDKNKDQQIILVVEKAIFEPIQELSFIPGKGFEMILLK